MNRDSKIVEIELEKIVPNRFQPRKAFNDDVSELAESIRAHGVLQPITVRPLGEKYEIVMGERRYRACEKIGMHKIPCMIVEMNDRESMEVALIENLQRQDLNSIEEALSYKRILDAGYVTQEQLAQRLGKNQSTIANKLRLLSLDRDVQSALLRNEISERHARALLKLENKEMQRQLLKKIIAERLTVKRTEEEIGKMENNKIEQPASNEEIEIIDFDDNPFNVEELLPSKSEIEDVNAFSEEPKEIIKHDSGSKNKINIPTGGIIDDLENNPNIISTVDFSEKSEDENIEESISKDSDSVKEIPEFEVTKIVPEETEKIELEEIVDKLPAEADTIKVPIKNSDFSKILEVIQKCQKDLEDLGYKTTFEKLDFEDMYEIIFKIHK